jgi:O2-independent ubiquinone biosynthesis accessory factor UbiT
MQPSNSATQLHPVLPAPLSLPFKLIPAIIHSKALVAALNRVFDKDLKEGELDFLQGKVVQISVEDAGIEYSFTLNKEKLAPANKNQTADIFLKGTVHDYMLLASRREDTDTLFFSRRLHMQGDTELGLYIKNFLDGLDMDSHKVPAYLESVLQKSLPMYERLFG